MDSPSSNLYPANNDSPAREKLLSLRLTLLRLHKTLLDMERREYERENGHVNTGELRGGDDQLKKLARVDVPVLALVFTALHIQKSLMQAEKCEAKGKQLLARGGIVVRGI